MQFSLAMLMLVSFIVLLQEVATVRLRNELSIGQVTPGDYGCGLNGRCWSSCDPNNPSVRGTGWCYTTGKHVCPNDKNYCDQKA